MMSTNYMEWVMRREGGQVGSGTCRRWRLLQKKMESATLKRAGVTRILEKLLAENVMRSSRLSSIHARKN